MDASKLIGMEFSIPVFNAVKQKYKCDDVKMEHVPNGKHYRIYFDEIQSLGYSVPERMELILEFDFSNIAVIKTRLKEIPGNGSKHEIARLQVATDALQSITQFKTFLGALGRKTV